MFFKFHPQRWKSLRMGIFHRRDRYNLWLSGSSNACFTTSKSSKATEYIDTKNQSIIENSFISRRTRFPNIRNYPENSREGPTGARNDFLMKEVKNQNNTSIKEINFSDKHKTSSVLSPKEFQERYYGKGPVIFRNFVSHWDAVKKWNDLSYFEFENLKENPNIPIEIGSSYMNEDMTTNIIPFDMYLHYLKKKEEEDEKKKEMEYDENMVYAAQFNFFDCFPTLEKDLKLEEVRMYTEATHNGEIWWKGWIGPKGTYSNLHQDPFHNLLIQIKGYKILRLFPLSDTPYLYSHQENPLQGNTSDIDIFFASANEIKEEFPEFQKANGLEILLTPGDVLYLPKKYWHGVVSLSTSISVSSWW